MMSSRILFGFFFMSALQQMRGAVTLCVCAVSLSTSSEDVFVCCRVLCYAIYIFDTVARGCLVDYV